MATRLINDVNSLTVGDFIEQSTDKIVANFSATFADSDLQRTHVLLVAILFLQLFVQANFTGPKLPFESSADCLGFIKVISSSAVKDDEYASTLQLDLLRMLSLEGQEPYHLSESPIFLVLALRLLEKLQGTRISLLDDSSLQFDAQSVVEKASFHPEIDTHSDIVTASVCWWRARALQILQSLYSDFSGILTALSLRLLSTDVVSTFIDQTRINSGINQTLLLTFHLESSKCALAGESESQAVKSLLAASKVSGLEIVLTSCKAKRTKYQEKSVSSLTVLAKSQDSLLRLNPSEFCSLNPQDVKLNDDTFLERPLYDSFDDKGTSKSEEEGSTNNDMKRVKIDYSNYDDETGSQFQSEEVSRKLLPTVPRKEDIPSELTELDPNNQPALSNLDNIQLLLRMQAVKQNSPEGSNLVNEELIALVQRVLFSPDNSVNWLIFSRALWSRSLLETSRPKTVERGVLQLYSLVEELGVSSDKTARLFPKADDEIQFPGEFTDLTIKDSKQLVNSIRLRYVHLLPAMPKWSMDTQLAEKLIQLGLYKSALEIYGRLEKWTDAAVCCATTGSVNEAESLVQKALDRNPEDARAWCILGDLRSDPSLWEKSWNLGRYANAKKSLAKYYYNPPRDSGLERDVQKAIDSMYDCLSSNPISFENWYFYGCLGLEVSNYELAAEAFRRCVTIDETSPYALSNLASSLIKLGKFPEAFQALSKAVNAGETSKKSWRIWENYLIVAVKLGKWTQVLNASIVLLEAKRDTMGSGSLDLPITEKLIGLLVNEPYDPENLSFFQSTCIDFVCNKVPSVVNDNSRCWRDIAKVDLWRRKPWLALSDYEKAYRATLNSPQLGLEESAWNEAIDTCSDLVSAYENLGELPGRLGAGDVVCKDWKFKAKSVIRSLLSKGKSSWEYTDGYERLQEMKKEAMKA
ncbi:DEKNAAC101140 [Brettanomyces naardenensis]|uniref:DEKNAAC101140 n=1 Tax=Brettanomyces naardenensis TaxID=13370 RepID=A0A448YH96_BRENA|nr:DEKNAAC101140 [Brettanomyces naardenensis]